jgi:YVTN family beta-propeller protein
MYVGNYGENTVSVIDSATDTVVATVVVGSFPIALAAIGAKMYVGNEIDMTDITTVTDSGIWVCDSFGNFLQFDNSLTLLQTFPIGTYPSPGGSTSVFGPVLGGAWLWLSDGSSVIWQLNPITGALVASWPMIDPAGWTGADVPMFWDGVYLWVSTIDIGTGLPAMTLIDPIGNVSYGPLPVAGFTAGDFLGVISIVKGSALASYQNFTNSAASPFMELLFGFRTQIGNLDPNHLPYLCLPFCVKRCN